MKVQTPVLTFLLASCCAFCAISMPVFAADTSSKNSPVTAFKLEAANTFKAIEHYSARQKDEAIKKTQAALAAIDDRIDEMENRFDARWHTMSNAARRKQQAALRDLKRERIKIAEWFGGMKNSTAETWEDSKKGFLKSCAAFGDAFTKAEKQLPLKKKQQ